MEIWVPQKYIDPNELPVYNVFTSGPFPLVLVVSYCLPPRRSSNPSSWTEPRTFTHYQHTTSYCVGLWPPVSLEAHTPVDRSRTTSGTRTSLCFGGPPRPRSRIPVNSHSEWNGRTKPTTSKSCSTLKVSQHETPLIRSWQDLDTPFGKKNYSKGKFQKAKVGSYD